MGKKNKVKPHHAIKLCFFLDDCVMLTYTFHPRDDMVAVRTCKPDLISQLFTILNKTKTRH